MTEEIKIKLDHDQQAVIDALVKMQTESRGSNGKPLSDDAFGKRIGMSGSKWNMCRHGNYWSKVDNVDSVIRDLKRSHNQLKIKSVLSNRFGTDDFIELDNFSAVFSAIQECQAKPLSDPIRIIVFTGETGAGKSRLCAETMRRFENVIVTETRDKWKTSKMIALMDICEAANVQSDGFYSPNQPEDALTDLFTGEQYILCLDEAEAFGPGILNSIKRWTNRTRLVILICAIQAAYLKWNKSFTHEARQIKSRTHIVIDNDLITTADVEKFLARFKFVNGELESSARLLAKTATKFGAFRLIGRTLGGFKAGQELSFADVQSALNVSIKNMGGVE